MKAKASDSSSNENYQVTLHLVSIFFYPKDKTTACILPILLPEILALVSSSYSGIFKSSSLLSVRKNCDGEQLTSRSFFMLF